MFGTVRGLVEAVPWPRKLRRKLVAYEYRSPTRRVDKKGKFVPLGSMTRPVQIYGRLYRARNMVLHGEPYEKNRLEPGRRHKSWGPLHFEAAVLFRSLLLHALAQAGHGQYVTRPNAAESKKMTLEQHFERWRDVRIAHDEYYKAFGRGLNPRPS
jgi:hypothetical protein